MSDRFTRDLKNIGSAKRIQLAKAKMDKVLDHFLYVLEIHANNKFIVFSPTLSNQIPESFAANAFNVFQLSMYQFEIVRLCAMWDTPDLAKENIPTVIELIDQPDIITALVEETRAQWTNQPTTLLNPSSDPALATLEQQAVRASNISLGNEEAAKADAELRETIKAVRTIFASPLLATVMNIRDKHLAHSLTETRREKRGPVAPMKNSDGLTLFTETIPIIERLLCWVSGKSFSIADSQNIDNENADALWSGCTFQVRR